VKKRGGVDEVEKVENGDGGGAVAISRTLTFPDLVSIHSSLIKHFPACGTGQKSRRRRANGDDEVRMREEEDTEIVELKNEYKY
jgi:hypothetical protein